jgi:hypothetical protein
MGRAGKLDRSPDSWHGQNLGEDDASEVAAEFPRHAGRDALPVAVVITAERRGSPQVLLDDSVEGGMLRTATAICNQSTSLWHDGHVGVRIAS